MNAYWFFSLTVLVSNRTSNRDSPLFPADKMQFKKRSAAVISANNRISFFQHSNNSIFAPLFWSELNISLMEGKIDGGGVVVCVGGSVKRILPLNKYYTRPHKICVNKCSLIIINSGALLRNFSVMFNVFLLHLVLYLILQMLLCLQTHTHKHTHTYWYMCVIII